MIEKYLAQQEGLLAKAIEAGDDFAARCYAESVARIKRNIAANGGTHYTL